MINTPCVIFAGGKSSRMGEDKSLLPFGSFSTLTEFQYSRLSKIFKTVYISCKDKSKFHFLANFIEDKTDQSIFAPTAGFEAVFNTLNDNKIFIISVDTPFVAENEINALFEMDNDYNDATIAKTNLGTQPLCGIYHRSLKEKFEEMLKNGNHKLGFLLKNSKTAYVHFENENAFLNLNHPHEYEAALKLISY